MSIVYWFARGGSKLAGLTPRNIRHTVGSAVGASSYLGWRTKRLITQQNMARVSGHPAHNPHVRRLAFTSWYNYGRYAADFMSFPYLDMGEVERHIHDLSEPAWKTQLTEALKPGRGAILASAHFGNWDLAGAIVARHFPLSAVAETFSDPRLNELLQSQRQQKGISIIPMEGAAARRILRVLQQNQLVALLVDRPMESDQGTPVTFFGQTTNVPSGTASLALRTGAAIVPGFVWYSHNRQYYLRAFSPIFPRACKGNDEKQAEIRRLTQEVYNSLESIVREWPTQWYMFRPFWPTDTL